MNSAQNCCSTMSCCRRPGATRRLPPTRPISTLTARRIWNRRWIRFSTTRTSGRSSAASSSSGSSPAIPAAIIVYRVAQVFNDNGTGVRGDLQAVIQAILLDYEARSPSLVAQPTYGKQREPLLRVTAVARAFPSAADHERHLQPRAARRPSRSPPPVPHRLNNGDTRPVDLHRHFGQSRAAQPGLQRDGHRRRTPSPSMRRTFRAAPTCQTNNIITVNDFRPRPGCRATRCISSSPPAARPTALYQVVDVRTPPHLHRGHAGRGHALGQLPAAENCRQRLYADRHEHHRRTAPVRMA